MEVESISAKGRNLHIKGKMMGQIPMQVVMGPGELRETFKMMSVRIAFQALRMLFLRSAPR